VGDEADAVDLVGQGREARQVADDAALELHGDHGGRPADQIARATGSEMVGGRYRTPGLRWRRAPW
jgi:hypothetical protein